MLECIFMSWAIFCSSDESCIARTLRFELKLVSNSHNSRKIALNLFMVDNNVIYIIYRLLNNNINNDIFETRSANGLQLTAHICDPYQFIFLSA